MSKELDLTGQKFNSLTAVRKIGKIEGKAGIFWEFQCDCGNLCIKKGSDVKCGNTKSCGCRKSAALKERNDKNSEKAKIQIGTRFGKLVVIEDIGFKPQYDGAKKNRRWYKCLCDCGNYCEAHGNALKNGLKISCGCIKSLGEERIFNLLKNNNYNFSYNVGFPDIYKETGHRLRFDFIIYNEDNSINRCIEFDGNQHKYGMNGGIWSHSETFEVIHNRDLAKNYYCQNHNIPLIRIPYYKLKTLKIEDLFDEKYLVKGDGESG